MDLHNSIKFKLRGIRCWFRYNFNKSKWRLIKTATKGYPFDFAYIWMLDKAKYEEMYEYFKKFKLTEDYHIIIRDLKLAINLLTIMIEDYNLYEYIGNKYICKVNVNLKNIDRFIKTESCKDYILNKGHYDELYVIKAKKLYYKLIENRIETWWN